MDGSIARYEAFVRVADDGSFTRAAAALRYSQPAVSRLVADLEREWGVQLLERSRAGVRLTAEGTRLLPAARALVGAQEEFRAQVDGLRNLDSGIIRIGTFSSVATHWLPRIVAAFQRDYPGIDYELFLGDYGEIEAALEAGRVDCGFLRLPTRPAFAVQPLAEDELLAVLPEGHPLAAQRSVAAEQLAAEPFILLEKDANKVVDSVFSGCAVQPRPRFTTWDDYAVMAMVEAGLGVSVLPALIMRRVPYRVVARPLAKPAFRTIGIATRKAAAQPLAVQRFMDYLPWRDAE